MELLLHYFPSLDKTAIEKISGLASLYGEWNEKINVISRKDMDSFYERHVLHSLAIAKFISFTPGTKVLDIGTGGGFPGIPLAILFPEVNFHLVDSIGKKITVVKAVAEALGLQNVKAEQARVEALSGKYDFIVSRAVAPVAELVNWSQKLLKAGSSNAVANGWILLKGGDLTQEIADSGKKAMIFEIKNYFKEEFFETKKVVYIPIAK